MADQPTPRDRSGDLTIVEALAAELDSQRVLEALEYSSGDSAKTFIHDLRKAEGRALDERFPTTAPHGDDFQSRTTEQWIWLNTETDPAYVNSIVEAVFS